MSQASTLRTLQQGVFVADGPVVTLRRSDVASLGLAAETSPWGRARICAHPTPKDPVHEMIIVLRRGSYIRPHRHTRKVESYLVLEGRADAVTFREDGGIASVVPMGDYASGRTFFHRSSLQDFHTFLVRSPRFAFHETTNGPFAPEETTFAAWSPSEADRVGIQAFQADLKRRLGAWTAGGTRS